MNLKEAFAAAYDRSWAEEALRRATRDGKPAPGATWLGTGSHFQAFRVPLALPGPSTAAHSLDSLVLKLATPSFAQPRTPDRRHWLEAMRRVSRSTVRLPMVPPWDLVEPQDGPLGMVMPYGPDPGRPTEAQTAELRSGLEKLGLELADVLQTRSLGGSTFVVDWSDLRALR